MKEDEWNNVENAIREKVEDHNTSISNLQEQNN